jgi:hypothetical protein
MFGKLVANCRTNFLVGLAVMTISGGKSLDVRDSLEVSDNDVRGHAYSPIELSSLGKAL